MNKKVIGVGIGAAVVGHVLHKAYSKQQLELFIVSLFFPDKQEFYHGSPERVIIHNAIYNLAIPKFNQMVNQQQLFKALVSMLDSPLTNELFLLRIIDSLKVSNLSTVFPYLYNIPVNDSDQALVYQMKNFFSWQHVCQLKVMPYFLPKQTKATLKRLGLPNSNFCESLNASLNDSFKKVIECINNNNKIEDCPILQELEPRKKDLMVYLQVTNNNTQLLNVLYRQNIIKPPSITDNFNNTLENKNNLFLLLCRQVLLASPLNTTTEIKTLFKEFQGKESIIKEYNFVPNQNIKKFDLLKFFILNLEKKDNIFNFKLLTDNVYLSDILDSVLKKGVVSTVLFEKSESESESETSSISSSNTTVPTPDSDGDVFYDAK